jgi:hypothetical protein
VWTRVCSDIHLDGLISTTTDDLVSYEVHTVDLVRVTGQIDADFARLEIPQLKKQSLIVSWLSSPRNSSCSTRAHLECSILARANQYPRIGRPCQSIDGGDVTPQRCDEPKADRTINFGPDQSPMRGDVQTHFPVLPSQSLTALSNPALAINRPSGLKATWLTCFWCPVRRATGFLMLLPASFR